MEVVPHEEKLLDISYPFEMGSLSETLFKTDDVDFHFAKHDVVLHQHVDFDDVMKSMRHYIYSQYQQMCNFKTWKIHEFSDEEIMNFIDFRKSFNAITETENLDLLRDNMEQYLMYFSDDHSKHFVTELKNTLTAIEKAYENQLLDNHMPPVPV